ncbi:hypothetical protein [Bradyrhizobium elkanii]|uniref:hypothetical protein n=1 Tax=Bradyrhizobium elkanii TaxID=29448 RepID=UPI002169252C|nr:hypothetical protein [Bradyrhizobium elkanii]MCS3517067.1 hypothetical protein [Bradyrhizobium elkanii]MCS4073624.1 hypothetical protein [Bradyrhizobium elkanii]MCS4080257.1 hypothetical protein [Bradyrhizobium elkanii]MDH6691850.1 hypothetical protein [Bradyrhizobium elkanii]
MAENSTEAKLDARIETAFNSDVPQLYCNAFTCGISTGDIVVALELNGKPIGTLNMSYTVAKTLGVSLCDLLKQFEVATNRTMLTTREVDEAMKAQNEAIKS